jgi:hypothetical protein
MIFLGNSPEPPPVPVPRNFQEFSSEAPRISLKNTQRPGFLRNAAAVPAAVPPNSFRAPPFLSPCSVFYFRCSNPAIFFSQTSFGPSLEVHGAFKTIMGLSRAQMGILIKTTSGSRWPLRALLPNCSKAVSELERSLRGRFGSNAHEKV